MNWLNLITLGVSIAERAIAAKGAGATKKQIAIEVALQSAPIVATLTETEINVPEVQEALSKYIDATVQLKNAVKKNTGKDI